ncbi:MAG: fimbrial biogenesis outer membrane usher protein [Betaproteobacteria bacterium]|nr:fimbrial biogenesis outer membrane usher protein [Betaproteobacteria bacterium]
MTNHFPNQEASPSTRPAWRLVVVAVLLACSCPEASARQLPAAAPAATNKDQLIAVEVVIDGASVGRANLLQRNGVIFAQTDQLDRWGLSRRLDANAYQFDGATWYSLASVPRLEAVHYFRDQRLELQGGARKPVQRIAQVPPPQVSSPPAPVRIEPLSPSAPRAVQAPLDSKGEPRLLPLDVAINGSREGNWLLLERGGALYAPADAFDEWRISRKQDMAGFNYRGQTWFPLASVPGFEAQLNAANQSVDLKFLPGVFGATKLTTAPQETLAVTPPLTSFFLNYDLNQTFVNSRGLGTSHDLGALTEVGVSGGFGVLTSAHVGRNIASSGPSSGGAAWRRLETTFTKDFPERNVTLRLGDTATRAGAWGRSSYFGGIQLARNYALTPGFITQPIPTITGQSSAPSTVELYINDALRQTSKVPTGPFAIDNFPLLTGSGQARVVVRDLLGRETVLVQNFFTHSDLLDQGLSDWSFDAGAVRRNLGLDNANYGDKFGSGLWRYGLSRTVTLEARAEAGKSLKGGGIGLSLALPAQMLGQIAFAGSDDREKGRGSQYVVGLEHSSLRHGFTVRAEGATRDYKQFGLDAGGVGYRTQLSASYTFASERFGHIGLGYARIDSFDHGPLTTYSANYSMRLGQRASLSLIATKVMGSLNADSVGMSLLIPLDAQINTTASAVSRDGKVDAYVTASKSMGIENGIAWRALAGSVGSDARGEGGLYYQGAKASASADVSVSRDQRTARLGMQGGFVFVDKRLYASRRIQDSFAVVEVPGYANVGVGFQSSVLTRTDDEGRALVPRLLPYRRNSIRLDPGELPINAEIDSIEQIVVPGSRVGVKVAYPVRDGRGALLKIVLDDGEPAPAGAELKLVGDNREFFTARRGEAFITGLKVDNTLVMNYNGQSCKMPVQMPGGKADEIARIGPIVCSGVKR